MIRRFEFMIFDFSDMRSINLTNNRVISTAAMKSVLIYHIYDNEDAIKVN